MTSHPPWPRPDFLAGRKRIPRLAWLWAATCSLVLVVATVDALDAGAAAKTQKTRLARAEQRLARARTAAAPGAASSATPSVARSDIEAVHVAQRTVDRLEHPWGPLLANVEAESPAGVQWLLFDHDADSSDLRFEGLAPDAATAFQVVDSLGVRRGWSDAVLTRLEAPNPRDATPAGPLWRFEIRAVIDPQRLAAAARSD